MSLGQGIGTVLGAIGGGLLAIPTGGMSIYMGAFLGASVGSTVGGMLFPPKMKMEAPASLNIQTSQAGLTIPVIYGTRVITGNCIWYGNFKAHKHKVKSGKGFGGSGAKYYTYSVSVAFGLAINKTTLVEIKSGKNVVDLSEATFYDGTQTTPDSHIASILTGQSITRHPVWKGLSYVVFPNCDLGSSTSLPIFTFKLSNAATSILEASADGGIYPDSIVKDALLNPFYGLGLNASYLDNASFTAVKNYCTTDTMKLSVIAENQQSILDFLQYILMHHNGLISYVSGLIKYKQLSEIMVASSTLTDEYFEKKYGEPYLEIVDKGEREYFNKVTIQYTKSDGTVGTTYASDLSDIDTNGLKDTLINLDGLSTFENANKMAQRLLNRSISCPQVASGRLGIASYLKLEPGGQINLTDSKTEFSKMVTVTSISLGDNYRVELESVEEIPKNYSVVKIGDDLSVPPTPPNLGAAPSSVIRPIVSEMFSQYSAVNMYFISYSPPNEIQWAMARLYKSYNSSANYIYQKETINTGVTGLVSAVGLLSAIAYIDITLDSTYTLESALDMDTLMTTPYLNLCGIKTGGGTVLLFRFEDVTLISGTTWRLSNLIYDIGNFSQLNTYGIILTGDIFYLLLEIPFTEELLTTDIGKTLYFKIASVNQEGLEQALGSVSTLSLPVTGLAEKPLSPVNITINGVGITNANSISIGTGDITIVWTSRNRKFVGMTDFARTDTSKDDIEFENFILEIYNGATLLRTVTQTGKSFIYTSAMQSSDGGYTSFNIKLQQKNSAFISDYSNTIAIAIV